MTEIWFQVQDRVHFHLPGVVRPAVRGRRLRRRRDLRPRRPLPALQAAVRGQQVRTAQERHRTKLVVTF